MNSRYSAILEQHARMVADERQRADQAEAHRTQTRNRVRAWLVEYVVPEMADAESVLKEGGIEAKVFSKIEDDSPTLTLSLTIKSGPSPVLRHVRFGGSMKGLHFESDPVFTELTESHRRPGGAPSREWAADAIEGFLRAALTIP